MPQQRECGRPSTHALLPARTDPIRSQMDLLQLNGVPTDQGGRANWTYAVTGGHVTFQPSDMPQARRPLAGDSCGRRGGVLRCLICLAAWLGHGAWLSSKRLAPRMCRMLAAGPR